MTSPQGKANQEAHVPSFSYPLEVLATSTEAWGSVTSQMGVQELGDFHQQVFDPFIPWATDSYFKVLSSEKELNSMEEGKNEMTVSTMYWTQREVL